MTNARRTEDVYWAALSARDPRFDGKFFVGVRTTGIYCRPVCPAKPKRENVAFFSSALAAERAGYRPCLRCRPESAPESPAWIGKSALVRRALKRIDHPDMHHFDEDAFAAPFGVTARHLRRLFVEELGKTPKQLFFDRRLNLARKLVVETTIPVTDIAFAVGFGSVRRFNDAFRARFTKSPRVLRRHRGKTGSGIRLSLAYRPPYDFASLLAFYRSHGVGHLERCDGEAYRRVVHLGGKVGTVAVRDDPERSRLLVDVDFPETSALHGIVTRVRRMFDVDCDPVLVANALETDPGVKRLLQKHPGIRLPSGWDGFEIAVGTILGQGVSVERARVLLSDVIERYGEPSGIDGVTLFPTPSVLAEVDLAPIQTTGVRKKAIRALSEALSSGTLSLEPTQDVDAFREALGALPGVGPWSANYIAMKVLRHTDAFPETDLILARALEVHGKDVLEAMSPWRAYAAALWWRAYAQTLSKANGRKR